MEAMFGISAHPVGSLVDELIEHLQSQFQFQAFPGTQTFPFVVAEFIEPFGIDVFSTSGQYILDQMIEALREERFGDYDRYLPCSGCGEEHHPDVDLQSVNSALVFGGWFCVICRHAQSGVSPASGMSKGG